MGKKMRKIALLFMASILFVLHLPGETYASEMNAEDMNGGLSAIDSADYEKINYSLNYLGYDCDDTIHCTDYIEADNGEGLQTKVSILYTDTEMIGEYVKAYDEENAETRDCFLVENNEEIFEALTGGESGNIEISVDGESIELSVDYDDIGQKDIETGEFELKEYQVQVNTPTLPKCYPTSVSDIEMMLRITQGATGYLVKVKNVENYRLSNGRALCWAACGASIVNYFMGTNYTAKVMFDKVNAVMSGTPTGTILDMRAMFDTCLLKYYQRPGKLAYTLVMDQHKKGSPIMCCIQGEDRLANNAEKFHAVVLCGSFNISTSYGYIYMDPNEYTKLVINYMDYSQITSSSDDLYYYGGGSIFYLKCNYTFFNFSKGV